MPEFKKGPYLMSAVLSSPPSAYLMSHFIRHMRFEPEKLNELLSSSFKAKKVDDPIPLTKQQFIQRALDYFKTKKYDEVFEEKLDVFYQKASIHKITLLKKPNEEPIAAEIKFCLNGATTSEEIAISEESQTKYEFTFVFEETAWKINSLIYEQTITSRRQKIYSKE